MRLLAPEYGLGCPLIILDKRININTTLFIQTIKTYLIQ